MTYPVVRQSVAVRAADPYAGRRIGDLIAAEGVGQRVVQGDTLHRAGDGIGQKVRMGGAIEIDTGVEAGDRTVPHRIALAVGQPNAVGELAVTLGADGMPLAVESHIVPSKHDAGTGGSIDVVGQADHPVRPVQLGLAVGTGGTGCRRGRRAVPELVAGQRRLIERRGIVRDPVGTAHRAADGRGPVRSIPRRVRLDDVEPPAAEGTVGIQPVPARAIRRRAEDETPDFVGIVGTIETDDDIAQRRTDRRLRACVANIDTPGEGVNCRRSGEGGRRGVQTGEDDQEQDNGPRGRDEQPRTFPYVRLHHWPPYCSKICPPHGNRTGDWRNDPGGYTP